MSELTTGSYHLLIRTQDANLSDAIRWLQVAYCSVFNWTHRLRGHLFQGRFRSLLIEDHRGAVEVARYLHLNRVRVRGLGLGKSEQRRARVTGIDDPGAATDPRTHEHSGSVPMEFMAGIRGLRETTKMAVHRCHLRRLRRKNDIGQAKVVEGA